MARLLGIALFVCFIIASGCSGKNDAEAQINIYDFLNQVLRDTSIVKPQPDSEFVLADVSQLPAPLVEGREIDFVSEKLGEMDSTFLRDQFSKQRYFKTDSLSKYGFIICKLSELRAQMSSDSLWNHILEKYHGGLYSVSLPIFNRSHDKVYLKVGYTCGPLCGGSSSYILRWNGNKWIVSELLGFTQS